MKTITVTVCLFVVFLVGKCHNQPTTGVPPEVEKADSSTEHKTAEEVKMFIKRCCQYKDHVHECSICDEGNECALYPHKGICQECDCCKYASHLEVCSYDFS
jgi:hypothetical protein